jgi:hypothetical protein
VPTILWPGREAFETEGLLVEPERVGWEAKPEGLCRGDACVPFPVDEGRVDLAAFAERLGAPVAREGDVWSFGEPPRRAPLATAPDFTLPELGGRLRSLSELRGRKVLLVTWASW